MDFNIEFGITCKLLKNKFEFLNINQHKYFFDFEIKYLEKDLLYFKVFTRENCCWDEDILFKIYSIDEKEYEIISIGASLISTKEIEIYVDIELFYIEEITRKNIPNNVIINKKYDFTDKLEYYEHKNFLYQNKFYLIENKLDNIYYFIEQNYPNLIEMIEYIVNEDMKNIIQILLYLNKNGGIFIDNNFKYQKLDELNEDKNICYINNNFISILFCKINFLHEELFLDDIKKKSKLYFESYFIDCEIKKDKDIILYKKEINYTYYTDIFIFDEYNFYLSSKYNIKYILEELPNKYFCLTAIDNDIETDLYIKIENKKENKFFMFEDNFIKNKFQNNYIFKI